MNEQCHSLFQGIINKMAKDLDTKTFDPKDPEELERYTYPQGFISKREQETLDKDYPYKN